MSCKIEGGVKAGCVVEQREVGGLVTHSESDYSTLDLPHQRKYAGILNNLNGNVSLYEF